MDGTPAPNVVGLPVKSGLNPFKRRANRVIILGKYHLIRSLISPRGGQGSLPGQVSRCSIPGLLLLHHRCRGGTFTQQRLANRLKIHLAGAQERDEALKPERQSLRKGLIFPEGFFFQP